jgi:hypothetical protein
MKRNIIIVLMMVGVMTVCVANAQDNVANATDKDTVSVQHDNGVSVDKPANADSTLASDDADTARGTLTDTDTASIPRDSNVAADTSINTNTASLSSGINPDVKPSISQDTVPKLSGTFFGLGFGLSIGNIPLFTMWQDALPTKIELLGLSPTFGIDTSIGDIQQLRYSVVESPEQFNFVMPLSVTVYNVKKNSVTAFSLSYFQNSKQFQSTIIPGNDTLGRRVNVHQILRYHSLTIEAAYHAAIPPVFFSIDGAQQSFFSLSAGISPLNYFSREGDATVSAPEGDSRMQLVADSAKSQLAPLAANGMAFTWRVGINTLKGYANGGGIEMGLFYSGSYSAYFYGNGEEITKSRIRAVEGETDKPLSFLSNRVEFKISFMRPAKRGNTEGAK